MASGASRRGQHAGAVGAVALAGEGQRAKGAYARKRVSACVRQAGIRPHSVGAGRANANLEEFKTERNIQLTVR